MPRLQKQACPSENNDAPRRKEKPGGQTKQQRFTTVVYPEPQNAYQVKEEKEAERKRKFKGKFGLWDHEDKSLFVWKEFSFHCLLLENLF